jgi:hypothetical protein
MERHIHRPILHLIAEAVVSRARRGKPTRLIKVAAHSGIVGNERADELAKRAGEPAEDDDVQACPAPATTPLHDLFWPTYTEEVEGGEARLRHVQDLRKSLKRQAHAVHRLGYANKDGFYFKLWQETANTAHGGYSNGFMSLPTGVDAHTRKLVIQARYGTLNTARWRYKCRLASTLACQLCGEPDGAHHSLSGCARMLGMYTQRHNEAGGIIYSTLAKGGLGAALVMQDIGRHNAAAEDPEPQAIEKIGTRLPPEIERLFAAGDRVSRPDILIADLLDMPTATVHIVEIKYCRDTQREARQAEGAEQHALLVEKLRQAYSAERVRLHVITLGVTGTIYTDLLETLEAMQVDKREAQRCAKKLHVHAVSYVRRIMHTKWNQEHTRGPDGPG